jgi:hypothetical protein
LPHCWQNHRNDWLGSDENRCRASHCYSFQTRFLGEKFLENDACQNIRQLFDRAKGGLTILGPTQDKVAREMLKLKELAPFPRLLAFLQILHSLTMGGADVQAH